MKIAVLGTFVIDDIIPFNGPPVKSLGGITYTISILANLLTESDEIYPVANVGKDAADRILQLIRSFENVKSDGINITNHQNSRVRLRYSSRENREEIFQNKLPPIEFEQVASLNHFDAILMNFITGFELPAETLNRIATQLQAISYMDYHSLCLGIDENGRRFKQKPENWQKWLKGINIVQMNDDEARILSDGGSFRTLAGEIIGHGVKIVNITRGSNGSYLFYADSNKYMKFEEIEAGKFDAIDVTGCGDAFAGGFIVDYLKHKNTFSAAKHANLVAGFNSSISGTEDIKKITNILHR
ncbi:hypothetical protein GF337_17495 [candidate division KSB1 bacterium]|nr:hypothetical protein [candidate division KSB1 bacterium]